MAHITDSEGISYDSVYSLLQSSPDFLGLCGCGYPEDNVDFIYKILKNIEGRFSEEYSSYDEYLKKQEGLCGNERSLIAALYFLDRVKLTSHGSSVYSSWLDSNGRKFIKIYEETIGGQNK